MNRGTYAKLEHIGLLKFNFIENGARKDYS